MAIKTVSNISYDLLRELALHLDVHLSHTVLQLANVTGIGVLLVMMIRLQHAFIAQTAYFAHNPRLSFT